MAVPVDIIVLSYNNFDYINRCVTSILNSDYKDIKIYIVDNASRPEVLNRVRCSFADLPQIVLIENKKNLGFAEGNNIALRQVRGKYTVILNNDTIVEPDWLDPMINMMESDEGIGACQPKILDMNDRLRFEYGGAAGGFIDTYGYPFLRGRIFDTVEADSGQYNDNVELDWCSGTAFIVRNEVLREVGLFDPIYFMYGEENDFCWRIRMCGHKIVFVHDSVVYHLGKGSIGRRPLFKLHLNYRNSIILLVKNLPLGQLIMVLPVRFLFDFVNIVFYLFDKPLSFRWISILWAYIELIFITPKVAVARGVARLLYKRRGKDVKYPAYNISIIYQYFLLGRKRFSELPLKR